MFKPLSLSLALLSLVALPAGARAADAVDLQKLSTAFRECGALGTSGQELWSSKVVLNGKQVVENERWNRVITKKGKDSLELRYLESHEGGKRVDYSGADEPKGTLTRVKGKWTWALKSGKPSPTLAKRMQSEVSERSKQTSLAWAICKLMPKGPQKQGATWTLTPAQAGAALEIPAKELGKGSTASGSVTIKGQLVTVVIKLDLQIPAQKSRLKGTLSARFNLSAPHRGHVEGEANMTSPGQSVHVRERLERGTLK